MRPQFQERFQVYVMGPNQDARLINVPAGQVIENIHLKIDLDAPFVLRSRAVGPVDVNLPFLKTKWTGPNYDYRQSARILESLQMPYFGQIGTPKPICPEITYPPGGTLTLDLENTSPNALTNVTFYWIGVNLYPWGVLSTSTYPAEFRGTNFAQTFLVRNLLAPDVKLNQPFTAKSDGDLIIRGGQAGQAGFQGGCPPVVLPGILQSTTAMSIVLRDHNGMAYMNDWVDINVLFGMGGLAWGAGPGHPGLIYPEIYLPAKRQLLIDVQQSAAGASGVGLLINFIGSKVFKGARE